MGEANPPKSHHHVLSAQPDTAAEPLLAWIGQIVILDTQGPLIFIGTLEQVGTGFLALLDADVHDTNDARATKELYIAETRELGVRINRSRVIVTRAHIASVSLLEEVTP